MAIKKTIGIGLVWALAGCGGGGGDDGGSQGNTQTPPPPPSEHQVSIAAGEGSALGLDGTTFEAGESINIESGSTVSFEINLAEGFELVSVSGCGGTLEGSTFTTGEMTADCTITVETKPVEQGAGPGEEGPGEEGPGEEGPGEEGPGELPTEPNPEAPTAEVLFPWQQARVKGETLVVSGIASDSDGVAEVFVNGVAATLTPVSAGVESSNFTTSDTDEATEVQWSASIPLEQAEQQMVYVATRDAAGNQGLASELTLTSMLAPTTFAIDNHNNRLMGGTDVGEVSIVDLETGTSTAFSVPGLNWVMMPAYVPDQDRLVHAAVYDGEIHLMGIDLVEQTQTMIKKHDLALEPVLWSFANVQQIAYRETNNTLYLLLTYFPASNSAPSRTVIFTYDFEEAVLEELASGRAQDGTTFDSDAMALTDTGILLFNDTFGGADSVVELAYDGSTIGPQSESRDLTLSSLAVDANSNALAAGYEGVAKFNIVTGEASALSLDSDDSELKFAQIRSSGMDPVTGNLLVGDSQRDMVISVDAESGDRSIFLHNGIGQGPNLIAPRFLVLDEANQTVYLHDDGGNVDDRILAVDLTTGDRRVVHQFEDRASANGLALDAENQVLYAAMNSDIYQIPLDGSSISLFATYPHFDEYGQGEYTNMEMDKDGQRLLMVDFKRNELVGIDLGSGAVTVLASDAVGMGDSLSGPTGISMGGEHEAYVYSASAGAVYKVDLQTGDRHFVINSCRNPVGYELLQDDDTMTNLHFDPVNELVWVASDAPVEVDVNTGECRVPEFLEFSLDIVTTSKGQVLLSDFNRLFQYSMDSETAVTLSK
ncbi:NHL repeat-containing protein [Ferrimonas marina]|uniref:Uncharacterized protein n=1 Tax=Ferrimonas marina TaxID=299255 RepID=A0A1M5P4E8_9GAMM|nr:hypothetical protein [Ferrimonas marina]SHG96704.1 hypothetical protein SAMN02745129_1287 [Ferrimonas marina]